MKDRLHLTITTPEAVLMDHDGIVSVRAEDSSGGFGILPGHAEFLTVLPPSIVRWRDGAGKLKYCAVRGGVMTVAGGCQVSIACRQALLGDDLTTLETEVHGRQAAEQDAAKKARVEQIRLHARIVRQLMHYLRPDNLTDGQPGNSHPTDPDTGSP